MSKITSIPLKAQNLAAIRMAVDRAMPVSLSMRNGSRVTIHPHRFAWSPKFEDYYCVDGKKVFWLREIETATLVFMECYDA